MVSPYRAGQDFGRRPAMLEHVKRHTVAITIGVSFFVFGFFIMANVLKLTDREIVIGLIAGSIGGITILVAMLSQERRGIRSAGASGASAG
jgi:hypothetical protein